MVFSRGLVISLGVSALSATLIFLYFRNRISSVEKKVDVMFDLIQSHQSDREQAQHMMMMQHQQNQAPSQNTGAWISEEDNRPERNLIDVSEDEDYDEEYDSEDSKEVSDNEDDLEERIKLVTTDIDIQEAEEAKDVEVLEANNTEPVSVDETIELQEVTDDLEEEEEELGSSADVENTVQSADKSNNDDDVDDVDDSLEEDDSDEDEDNSDEPTQELEKEVEYNKLKVAELKALAEAMGLTNYKSLKKQPLIDLIKASE